MKLKLKDSDNLIKNYNLNKDKEINLIKSKCNIELNDLKQKLNESNNLRISDNAEIINLQKSLKNTNNLLSVYSTNK